MRYQSWDVLVFPNQSKIPLQEFKTSCQVVQDPEAHNLLVHPQLLPTVTSFIPSLSAGDHFRISIHSWQNPETSRILRDLRKPSDTVVFEARLFIDGRIAGSKWFYQIGPWPTVLDLSIDLDKNGDFEKLRFPEFHKELLSQSYWNPGDDFGRVKVIIAEGFVRENQTYPFERVKNIVSFSFQHAPLDVLESSAIAWPNPAMWRQASLAGPYFPHQYSPRQGGDGVEAHSHSPRHEFKSTKQSYLAPTFGSMYPPNPPLFPRQSTFDPFTDQSNPAFTGWRQASSNHTDVSMPDASIGRSRSNSSRQVSDPMQGTEKTGRKFESMQMAGAYDSLCEALMPSTVPSVPVNTPQNAATPRNVSAGIAATVQKTLEKVKVDSTQVTPDDEPIDSEQAELKRTTIIKPSASNSVKSRKEVMQESPVPAGVENTVAENTVRIVSQPFITTNNAGTKRSRVVTPAASKVIDEEDEPRSSPSLRKVSRASTKDGKENERKVLGGIENVNV